MFPAPPPPPPPIDSYIHVYSTALSSRPNRALLNPLTRKQLLLPPFWSKGGGGVGGPIPSNGQTLWYSMYYNPLRCTVIHSKFPWYCGVER